MSCECGGQGNNLVISQLDFDTLTSLRSFSAEGIPEEYNTQRIWMIGSQPTIANGTADGKRGCVTIPFFGIPVKLCWEIKEADLIPPEVSVSIRINISVNDVEYLSATLVTKCENILVPSTCSVTVENEHMLINALRPRCNWDCLKRCAPGCLSCGTDYWCWAGCAGTCILSCCRL